MFLRSCRLPNCSIYKKNGFLIVPFLTMIATSADPFASHVLLISAATVYGLSRYTKSVGCCSSLSILLDATHMDDDPMLVGFG